MKYIFAITLLFILFSCSKEYELKICGSEINRNQDRNIKWFTSTTNFYGEKLILKINENSIKKISKNIYRLWYRRIANKKNKLFFVGSKDGAGFVDYEIIINCKHYNYIKTASFVYDNKQHLLKKIIRRYYDNQARIFENSQNTLDVAPLFRFVCHDDIF